MINQGLQQVNCSTHLIAPTMACGFWAPLYVVTCSISYTLLQYKVLELHTVEP